MEYNTDKYLSELLLVKDRLHSKGISTEPIDFKGSIGFAVPDLKIGSLIVYQEDDRFILILKKNSEGKYETVYWQSLKEPDAVEWVVRTVLFRL